MVSIINRYSSWYFMAGKLIGKQNPETCEFCHFEGSEGPNIDYDGLATDKFHLYNAAPGRWFIECYADQSSRIFCCPMCGRDLP